MPPRKYRKKVSRPKQSTTQSKESDGVHPATGTEENPAPISCKYCGNDTYQFGTKQCDNCYEVRCRIGHMSSATLAEMMKDAHINILEIVKAWPD